jgi:chromosomal replication initiation ATPase DnaA
VPESKRLAPGANDIINSVSAFYGIDKAYIRAAKRGTVNEERDMAICLLCYIGGDSLASIGKVFDIQSYSTVGSIIARLKIRLKSERKLLRKVEEIRGIAMSQE